MTGYDFHPEAAADLDEIWEFIADNNLNLDAADRVIADILAALAMMVESSWQQPGDPEKADDEGNAVLDFERKLRRARLDAVDVVDCNRPSYGAADEVEPELEAEPEWAWLVFCLPRWLSPEEVEDAVGIESEENAAQKTESTDSDDQAHCLALLSERITL